MAETYDKKDENNLDITVTKKWTVTRAELLTRREKLQEEISKLVALIKCVDDKLEILDSKVGDIKDAKI